MHPEAAAATTALNHVAMTMAADELDRDCEEILAFYGALFGWTGARRPEEPGSPLLLRLGAAPAALYVYGESQGTAARPMDHFGVLVATEDDLDAVLERARDLHERDPRVEIIEKAVTPAGDIDVVNCYIRFVLPLMVEVQHVREK